MSRPKRPLLLGLLCLLVLSWGTCPCVISRAFASEEPAEATAAGHDCGELVAPVGCPCCCCKQPAAESQAPEKSDERRDNRPDECPCCARGGANRDLPPAAGGIALPPAPEACDLDYPEPVAEGAPLLDRGTCGLEATGPPSARSPHGCPVGIVLLLN